MSGIYIQLANELKKLTNDVTADQIKKALGYTPASQESVDNVLNDESAELYITDKNGNIIALFDKEGLHTTEVEVGEFKVKEHVKNGSVHVTETERTKWNNKSDLPNIVDDESDSYYITDVNGNIIFMVDKDGVHTTKVNGKDVAGHIDDSVIHITEEQRTVWNNKSDFNGSYNSLTDLPNILDDESDNYCIADDNGNIIFKVDKDGAHTTNVNINGRDVGAHIDNITSHVSEDDRIRWNNKSDFNGSYNSLADKPELFDGQYSSLTGTPDIEQVAQEILNIHTSNKENPHSVTKSQVGLGNVDNTSDMNKPVSTAQQAALDDLQKTMSEQLVSESDSWTVVDSSGNIVATIDKDGVHTTSLYLNGSNIGDKIDKLNTDKADKAHTHEEYATVTALNTHANNTSNPHSVTAAQIGLGNVNNTSDADKPISTATQTVIDCIIDGTTTVAKADSATKDSLGRNISETYAALSDLSSRELYAHNIRLSNTMSSGDIVGNVTIYSDSSEEYTDTTLATLLTTRGYTSAVNAMGVFFDGISSSGNYKVCSCLYASDSTLKSSYKTCTSGTWSHAGTLTMNIQSDIVARVL